MDKIKKWKIWGKIIIFWPVLLLLVVCIFIFINIDHIVNYLGIVMSILFLVIFILGTFFMIPICLHKLTLRDSRLTNSWRLGYITFAFIFCTVPCFILFNKSIISIYNGIRNENGNLVTFLNVQLILNLVTMLFLCFTYLYFCLNMLKKELHSKYALFVSSSIKSLLRALASSLAIIAALSYLDTENEIFQIISKNMGVVVAMLYPVFDMYEYTYKKINEYEKEKGIENKKKSL